MKEFRTESASESSNIQRKQEIMGWKKGGMFCTNCTFKNFIYIDEESFRLTSVYNTLKIFFLFFFFLFYQKLRQKFAATYSGIILPHVLLIKV